MDWVKLEWHEAGSRDVEYLVEYRFEHVFSCLYFLVFSTFDAVNYG